MSRADGGTRYLGSPTFAIAAPYNARHSSVSWSLMIGKSPLWVSKQHGHRPETMFRAYAAWAEGAPESEVAVIRAAMGLDDQRLSKKAPRVGTKIGTSDLAPAAKPLKTMDLIGGKGGTRVAKESFNFC